MTAPTITGTPASITTLGTSTTPGAQSVTVPADATGVVVLFTGLNTSTALSLSMTSNFAGTFDVFGNGSTTFNGVYVGLARVTSTGSKTFTPSWNVTLNEGPCCSYAFVKDIPPSGAWYETVDLDQGNTGALSLSVTSATDSLVLFWNTDDTTPSLPSGHTDQTNMTVNGDGARLSTVNSPGAGTTNVTGTGTSWPACALISLKALVAAATTTVISGAANLSVGSGAIYTAKLDDSPSGTVNVTFTAPVAGSFVPSSVALTSANWGTGLTAIFTPTAAGSGNISSTNDGGLSNGTVAVASVATVAGPIFYGSLGYGAFGSGPVGFAQSGEYVSAGGGVSLVIQDMAHGVAIDNIALTSQLGLSIADMAHGVTIDNIVLTSQLALAVADMAHGVTIDNLTLAAIDSTSLVVADMLHAVTIDAPVLTTTTVLAIADLAHALAIDNLALTLDTSLVIAELTHALAVDNLVLTLDTSLVIAELAHTLTIDNLTLSTAASTNLTVADLLHAVTIDNVALTSQLALVVADMAHALAIDNLVLTSATTLAIAELAHTVAIDNLTLTALTGTNLLIDDTTHAVSIDNVVLTSATALVIADMVHALAFDNVTLTSATALVIADMLHGVSIDNLTLSIPGGGYSTLDLIFKILTNRQELSPTAGTFTLYDDDSTTVLYTAAAWADAAGTVPYAGGKLQRIDRMT